MTSLVLNTISKAAARSGNAAAGGRSPTLKRSFTRTPLRQAIMMPAMSPFMTEGTITRWKKKEGESFTAGEVLLQIESDYTTVDVQAENSGIIGKILMPDGASGIRVEQVIALVAKDTQELATIKNLAKPPPFLSPVPPSPSPANAQTSWPVTAQTPLFPPSPSSLSATFAANLPFSPRVVTTPPSTPGSRSFGLSHFEQAQQSFFHNTVHRSFIQVDMLNSASHSDAHARAMSTSASATVAAAADPPAPAPVQVASASGSTRDSQEGLALRRKVLSGLSTSKGSIDPSVKPCATTEYFDGIL